MISLKGSYSLTEVLAARRDRFGPHLWYLCWFCAFIVLMAFLELGQDYISAILNDNHFQLAESLSYKLFWLLFIPFAIVQLYVLEKTGQYFSGTTYVICNTLVIPVVALVHLMIFSLFLFSISILIHESPWSLPFLIAEKLSTRLYIGLSMYIAFPALYFLLDQKGSDTASDPQKYSDTIPVKNGQKTVLVHVDEINWIRSDGPYLYIHAADKKHVVLDSLKNIITTLPDNFRRIHRSTIVNMDVIKKLQSRGNGDYDIILDDGKKLRLSRNYAKPLKEILL